LRKTNALRLFPAVRAQASLNTNRRGVVERAVSRQ